MGWRIVLTIVALWLTACAAGPETGAAPATKIQGTGAFQDGLATMDQFVLDLTGVAPAPAGQVYQGWLVRGDETPMGSIGTLQPTPDGTLKLTWNAPSGENLLSRYQGFQLTLEPNPGSEQPTGGVVAAGALTGQASEYAQQLFIRNQADFDSVQQQQDNVQPENGYGAESPPPSVSTPRDTPFAIGLKTQTDLALQHVQNSVNAAAIGAQSEANVHLEHVVNILEGARGERFGDYDGDGVAQNPGDGFGVQGYSKAIGDMFVEDKPEVTNLVTQLQTAQTPIVDKAVGLIAAKLSIEALNKALQELQQMTKAFADGPVANLYHMTQQVVTFEITSPTAPKP